MSVTLSGWRMRWLAIAYLALLLIAATYVFLASTVFYEPEMGANFSPLWLTIVTFPSSAVLAALFMALVPNGVETQTLLTTLFAAGMLQALLLYRVCRRADEQAR